MDFLSLNEMPAPRAPRVTRAEAIGLSLLAHVLLILLFVQGEKVLPEGLRRWLAAHAPNPVATRPADPANPVPPEAAPKPNEPETRKMPVKFAYVKVPDDAPAKPNPLAPFLSDRDRRARQEEPTPDDARRLGPDPHSKGDTIDRVRPDPNMPEGPDVDHPIGRETPETPKENRERTVEGPEKGEGRGPGAPGAGEGEAAETVTEEATIAKGELVPPPGSSATAFPPAGSDRSAGRSASPGNARPGSGGGTASTPNLKPGTEYKFQFNNPGWMKDKAYGTMSFDTRGFPWGDYARKLYVAIRNRWLERIPLAAREGMAGYTCQHFMIARDGTVTSIDILRSTPHPSLTKAATDAINAANKVPPLPGDFPKESEGVTFCFYYNMYPGEED